MIVNNIIGRQYNIIDKIKDNNKDFTFFNSKVFSTLTN
jgi:hypothetical protein